MNGAPLLLLPGLMCNELLWEPQVAALRAEHEIKVADFCTARSIAEMAQHALAQAPWPRFALAGLSMGGIVAMELMRQAPQRVLKLALLDTNAGAETPASTERRMVHIAAAKTSVEAAALAFFPLLVHPTRSEDADLKERFLRMARAIGAETFIAHQHALMARADSLPSLADIACSSLVLCGRQDAICPLAMHEEIAARIPQSRLRVIEDCGHLPTWERPEATNAALREWLAA